MTFTPEQITAMAKEARIGEMGLNIDGSIHLHALFTRFAALAAEKAAAEEREGIAQMVLETAEWRSPGWTSTICPISKQAIAAAIRARGQKE